MSIDNSIMATNDGTISIESIGKIDNYQIRTIAIFCGARSGHSPNIEDMTRDITREISASRVDIICGGGSNGLMGAIADAAKLYGGNVIGIFSNILHNTELPSEKLSSLIRTECLQSRKREMMDASDAFLILPGGYGTLDELSEVLTLRKLGMNKKPVILMNYCGFWDALLQQIDKMKEEGFVPENDNSLVILKNVEQFKRFLNNNLFIEDKDDINTFKHLHQNISEISLMH